MNDLDKRFLQGMIDTWVPVENGRSKYGMLGTQFKHEEFIGKLDGFFKSYWNNNANHQTKESI